jgi:hypothetical protein
MGMMKQAKSAQTSPPEEEMPVEDIEQAEVDPAEAEGAVEEEVDPANAASANEQEEYDRAMQALYTVLYQNEKTAKAVADQLNAEDKVGSVTRAGILLIKSLDERISMDEEIIPQMTREVADSLIEIAEAKGVPEFAEGEVKAVLGSMWEGVMAVFGMSKEDAEDLRMDSSPEELNGMEEQYRQFLGEASQQQQPSAPPAPAPAPASRGEA